MLLTLVVAVALIVINLCTNSEGLMKAHISHKYGIDENKITVLEYKPSHFDTDFGFLGLDASNTINYINRKWQCEYEGRQFVVEYFNLKYMDDYQLEDIFNWCTEYLQENYDKDIVGVKVYSDIIYHSPKYDFDYALPWGPNKVFNKNDAKAILGTMSKINFQQGDAGLSVFYEAKDLDFYAKFDSLGWNRTENENYYSFKSKKEKLLSHYGKCNIIVIDNVKFSRSDIGIVFTHNRQPIISTTDNKYVFNKHEES